MKKTRGLNFDIKQLKSFLEVLKQGSFTRASRKLKLGQATISHHIKELEEALGTELINRSSKKISITEQGRKFRTLSEQMLAGIEDFTSGITSELPGGTVRIAASTIPSAFILPNILANVKSKFPDLVYRIEVAGSREAVEMVKEGRADFAVVGEEYKNPTVVFTRFYQDRIVLIGARGYPYRISVAELTRLPFIIREPGSGTRRSYERALAKCGVRPSSLSVVMECSSIEGTVQSVAAGIGVSFISNLAVKNINQKSSIRIIEVEGLEIIRHFFLVNSAKRAISRPATIVIASLAELNNRKEKLKT